MSKIKRCKPQICSERINKMTKHNQTPIEEVFSGNSPAPRYLTERALAFCGHYQIKTAEQLAGICKDSFTVMASLSGIGAGTRAINYVFRRMRRKGFPMSERKFRRMTAFEIVGKENIKGYLLAAMTDIPIAKSRILLDAECNLQASLVGHLFEKTTYSPRRIALYKDRELRDYKEYEIRRFVEHAFHNPQASSLFDELAKERGAVAKPLPHKTNVLGYSIPDKLK